MFQMLAKAIDKAGSTDPLKVALALEDMKSTDLVGFPGADAEGRSPVADALLRRQLLRATSNTMPRRPAWAGRPTSLPGDRRTT